MVCLWLFSHTLWSAEGRAIAWKRWISSQLIGGCSKYMELRGWAALKTLPQMQSAAVYFLGEASLQNKRKAFQKGWCKTGFVFQREVDPASLSHFLNWLRRQVPWSQGDAIETLNRNRAELLLCWAALQLETCIQKEGESREAKFTKQNL